MKMIRQVGHAGQHFWMFRPKHPLSRLHHLHLQSFSLLLPPLIALRGCQIGHVGRRVSILRPKQ